MKQRTYKILVPIDFSVDSRNAVKYVLNTFGDRLTHLYLLNAYKESTPSTTPLISLIDILREKSERLMQQELRHVESMVGSMKVELVPLSRFDGFVDSIVEITKQAGIDLVAIGTNGHTHPRFGQQEDEPSFLLHKINLPLLLVPKVAN